MKFTRREIRDLFLSWILLSVAFAILFSGGRNLLSSSFGIFFLVSLLTAGIGFLLHELAHKVVAQNYGLRAEFQAFYKGIFIAIALAFFGFIFAAPGAVMIYGAINRERNGKISIAGPLTNLVLAVLFLVPVLVGGFSGVLGLFFELGFRINALLALFNMIPVMPFDGAKVFAWSKPAFWSVVIVSGILFIGSFFI